MKDSPRPISAGVMLYASPLHGGQPPHSPPAGPETGPETGHVDRHSALAPAQSVGVPSCVTDPNDYMAQEVIVGAGTPIKAWCTYQNSRDPGRGSYLLHQAGSTILSTGGEVYRVADGRRTFLAEGFRPHFSHDGRYLVLQGGEQCGPGISFSVYKIATGAQISTTAAEVGNRCVSPDGIDDLGRVYVTVSHEGVSGEARPEEIRMYDTRSDQWTRVVGVPASADWPWITYVTTNGIAVESEVLVVDGNRFAATSIEGVVDARGRLGLQREVPVGFTAVWSPDRSLVVESRPVGVVVLAAADMSKPVKLDLSADQFAWTDGPKWSIVQWVSPRSVLVQNEDNLAYRCDVESAACEVLRIPGRMASAQEGGR